MSKLAHSSTDEMMDEIERQHRAQEDAESAAMNEAEMRDERARFIKEQEAKQAAYAAKRKAWRDSLDHHDYTKAGES